jgi:hydroxymethylpyrimidine pyrophosphatase-like HAD family hydrolase
MPDGFCELIAAVEKEFSQVGIQICGFERTYFARDNRATALFRERTGVPHLLCPYREVPEPVAKVLFCTDSEEDIGGVERALRAHPLADAFSFVRSERTLFEILPPGVQKGLALAKLTEQLGVDPRRTLAVGDYDNDVGMFRAAAFGIAVANASPAAKAAANCFTVSNEEHAIARVIADLESGKYALPTV